MKFKVGDLVTGINKNHYIFGQKLRILKVKESFINPYVVNGRFQGRYYHGNFNDNDLKLVVIKYKYIKIDHEGEDYINVKVGKEDYDITGPAISIIKTLLKRINK